MKTIKQVYSYVNYKCVVMSVIFDAQMPCMELLEMRVLMITYDFTHVFQTETIEKQSKCTNRQTDRSKTQANKQAKTAKGNRQLKTNE